MSTNWKPEDIIEFSEKAATGTVAGDAVPMLKYSNAPEPTTPIAPSPTPNTAIPVSTG